MADGAGWSHFNLDLPSRKAVAPQVSASHRAAFSLGDALSPIEVRLHSSPSLRDFRFIASPCWRRDEVAPLSGTVRRRGESRRVATRGEDVRRLSKGKKRTSAGKTC